jgi:L-alanine-DL-glutamate epimerase-like enolase superfamily enzyme
MKIVKVEPILCDGGFRPWTFVKVETDEGITGYGDCSDWGLATSVAEAVRLLAHEVVGEDPRNIEKLWWKMYRRTLRAVGGVVHKALAGIDSALWDIKGKLLGVPVYELLGGRCQDKIRLYWTHCGTTRAFWNNIVGKPKIESYEDIEKLGKEVVRKGYTALKTNIFRPGAQERLHDVNIPIDNQTIHDAITIIRTFREAVGEDVDIALDVACKFDMPSAIKLARSLEPYNLMWLEEPIPIENPEVCLRVKTSTKTPICMSEGLYGTYGYRRFLELQAIDIAMPDIAWNGISMGKKIANLCETYYIPIAPHNCHSPLCTIITAHLCASIHNFMIMEFDEDDVPWRDRVLSEPLKIRNGYLELPTKPGYGVDLNEDEIAKHPYKPVPGAV